MDTTLQHDLDHFDHILTITRDTAAAFLHGLSERPVGMLTERMPEGALPEQGLGAAGTLDLFNCSQAVRLSILLHCGRRFAIFMVRQRSLLAVRG